MTLRRIRAIAVAVALAISAATHVARADDEDPNIVNWATIGDPGSVPPPINVPVLSQFGDDVDRPKGSIDGMAQVQYRDGSSVGCAYRDEHIYVMPLTRYTFWLIKERALQSRAGKTSVWWGMHPAVPLLSAQSPSAIRQVRCGAWNQAGYFYLGGIPTGKYIVIADVAKKRPYYSYESGVDYNPFDGENGSYHTTDETTTSMVWSDSYELYSSVDVERGNSTYHVPPFQVLYHFHFTPVK